MSPLAGKIQQLLPNRHEDPEKRYFKTVVLLSVGIILLMVMAGLITFFLTLDSEELTMVPDLEGLELENALLSLEERALFPKIQLRYSTNPSDKGTVIGQEPLPGTSLKAGSRILLKVSKGSAIEKLDDFTGWNLDDLEAHLKSLVTIYGPLLSIERPVVSVYDEAPSGTILEQKPAPGTDLVELTPLQLVVSRGPFGQTWTVLDYVGLPYTEVIASVVKTNIPFIFTSRASNDKDEIPGTVVSQSPEKDSVVPTGTFMQFVIAEPEDVPEGYVFGILERTLPTFEVPVRFLVEAVSPQGDVKTLFSMRHPGGPVTVPYLEPENTTIRLIVAEQAPISYIIKAER